MLKVTIDLEAIRHNYRFLGSICGSQMMPVVKADAYGHGLVRVALALASEGAEAFAVGTVDEGLGLREHLHEADIYSLMGPVWDEDYQKLTNSGITSFIHSWEQLKRLAQEIPKEDIIEIGIKFDTGMSRLGFEPGDAGKLCDFFNDNSRLRLKIISSHLAFADDPRMAHQVGEQVEILDGVSRIFAQAGLKHKKSLANSAAILHSPGAWSDIVRPGIALYGGNPFTGTSCEEKGLCLKQVMKVRAPVLSVHNLPKGRGISYGLTFTAPRDMRVAIIGCGYAHNYSRSLSNRAWMLYKDRRLPVIGRVCMQLTAVDASCVPLIKPGDEVFILGGNGNSSIEVHELSAWWKTVSYEVLCLLGKNEKTYINS